MFGPLKPPLIKVIRNLRPDVCIAGIVAWIVHRIFRALTAADWATDSTILDLWLQWMYQFQQLIWSHVLDDSKGDNGIVKLARATIAFAFQMFYDMSGILLILGTLRIFYCLCHFTWAELRTSVEDSLFEWIKEHVSAVSTEIDKEIDKMTPEIGHMFGRGKLRGETIRAIPHKGRNPWQLFQELAEYATQEHNSTWKQGKMSGTVYVDDEKHIQLMNEVYGLYSVANTLHPGVWPKLAQCESELIAMTSHMLHGTGVGCTTSGGTESVMLAIKAHWIYYGKRRGISHPELICGSTAHASVDKACEVFGIRKVCIDCNNPASSYTLSPKSVERRITANTIMIYASAPNYPQGTIDPIEDLGMLAKRYDIGLHVDSCLGGFVLPFARPGTFPVFDFRVPGVTSMSADTHKFGYAPKGTSVVLYRAKELRHAQYFTFARWTGGMYATPTFAGSRPSALIGCAWASLLAIGLEGYQQRTQQILDTSQRIVSSIRNEIPELFVLGDETQSPTMVVCFGSHQLDIYRIADVMQTKGWSLSSLQNPASVHLCVTLPVVPHADKFVKELKEAVAQVLQEEQAAPSKSKTKQGTAGMYGMTGSLPEGPVNELLKAVVDVGLTPK